MNTTFKVNLKEETCDVEIHGLPLRHIEQLSTIKDNMAEYLTNTLIIGGMESAKAKEAVSLLLQGKLGIQNILKAIP